MYHQLNKVTGRLAAATHLQSPLLPVAPVRLQRAEPPQIVHTASQMSTVTQSSSCETKQRLVPGTNIPYPPVPESLKRKQELFQRDNGLPVFLKGGPADVILYRFTLLLSLIGLGTGLNFIYHEAYPDKKN